MKQTRTRIIYIWQKYRKKCRNVKTCLWNSK